MFICLERGADLHMVQLMPLPLTVSCFSKIQIGFTFLVLVIESAESVVEYARLSVHSHFHFYFSGTGSHG